MFGFGIKNVAFHTNKDDGRCSGFSARKTGSGYWILFFRTWTDDFRRIRILVFLLDTGLVFSKDRDSGFYFSFF